MSVNYPAAGRIDLTEIGIIRVTILVIQIQLPRVQSAAEISLILAAGTATEGERLGDG
jgi:hypothetical protein